MNVVLLNLVRRSLSIIEIGVILKMNLLTAHVVHIP